MSACDLVAGYARYTTAEEIGAVGTGMHLVVPTTILIVEPTTTVATSHVVTTPVGITSAVA